MEALLIKKIKIKKREKEKRKKHSSFKLRRAGMAALPGEAEGLIREHFTQRPGMTKHH